MPGVVTNRTSGTSRPTAASLDEPEPLAHLAVNSETMGGLPITGMPKLPALTQGLATASPVPELGQSGPVSDLVGWLGGSFRSSASWPAACRLVS